METPFTSVSPQINEYAAVCSRLRVAEKQPTREKAGTASYRPSIPRAVPAQNGEALRILQERAVANLAMIARKAGAEVAEPEFSRSRPSADSVTRDVLSFGSSVFDAWRQCYTDLDDAEARAEFARRMSEALDTGFRETQAILDSLHAFYSDLESISGFLSSALGQFTK